MLSDMRREPPARAQAAEVIVFMTPVLISEISSPGGGVGLLGRPAASSSRAEGLRTRALGSDAVPALRRLQHDAGAYAAGCYEDGDLHLSTFIIMEGLWNRARRR